MNKIVILAAGKGTRMDSDLPKVLVPLYDRPMISYLMESIKKAHVDDAPILVVSPDNEEIIKESVSNYPSLFAIQEEQLGTGHALNCARSLIENKYEHVIVFYGDHPFVQSETIQRLVFGHEHSISPIAMMTTKLKDFEDDRKSFIAWGRIIRENNIITNIIEYKDATEEERQITEVNPGFYCFKSSWLWENIDKLQNNNKQKEYYLTDLIKIATEQGFAIHDIPVDSWETIGINSKEELAMAEKVFEEKMSEKFD